MVVGFRDALISMGTNDQFGGYRGSGTDITAQRISAKDNSRLATYDSLTGLLNRFPYGQVARKDHIVGIQAATVRLFGYADRPRPI